MSITPPSACSAPSALAWAAAYRFADLGSGEALAALRERLWQRAAQSQLVGTVLLASEGINLMVAGEAQALEQWLAQLQREPGLAQLDIKRQPVRQLPFQRLKVKIKREIIRMNQPAVRPAAGRAPAVDAPTLARWLAQGHDDQGRTLVLLDTRNDFEVREGAFAGALHWQLERFSDFPAALQAHAAELQGKTVVSYCTGGIRCEKAALWMQAQGLHAVHQLEGGILRYFEQVPGAPGWLGRCTVFDERGALSPSAPSSTD